MKHKFKYISLRCYMILKRKNSLKYFIVKNEDVRDLFYKLNNETKIYKKIRLIDEFSNSKIKRIL